MATIRYANAILGATERNGRKTLTTIQGLPKKYAFKKILRLVKKRFVCNGTIIEDEEHGSVIQLQGDHRNEMLKFLTDPETSDDKTTGIGLDEKTIKVHGF